MYAIIEDSGKQYKVNCGDIIDVDLHDIPDDAEKIEFDRVLMVGQGSESQIGTPLVEGAKVVATIQGQSKGPKINFRRFTRRKGYHRFLGHRQRHLRVRIDEIIT